MHKFPDEKDGLCSGDFIDLPHACIMPSNEVYELNFYADCNDDENIRKDIEHNFYNLKQPIYSFDIKPFSATNIEDYNKVIDMLAVHLDMHPCCIHISNFCFQDAMPPQYEKIDEVRHIVDNILNKVVNSLQNHVVEFHLKCYDYDNVYDSKYYHQNDGYILKTYNELRKQKNVKQVIITESSYNKKVTKERDRSVVEYKPNIN